MGVAGAQAGFGDDVDVVAEEFSKVPTSQSASRACGCPMSRVPAHGVVLQYGRHMSETVADLESVHIADSEFWAASGAHRHGVFEALRRGDPVRWFEPRRSGFERPCSGFWALTRHGDVWAASRRPDLFCSGLGIDIEESPAQLAPFVRTMITMDDPEHARLRRLVSSAFTPKTIAALDDQLRLEAGRIIDEVLERFGDGAEFDFVEHVAARLPLAAICDLVGVPEADRAMVYDATNRAVSVDDPSSGVAAAVEGMEQLSDYALALGRDRLRNPADDLASRLMAVDVEGERLSDEDFSNFFVLLISAGNETTRNAMSHGLSLLTRFPDQRRRWFGDFETHAATAVEEIVRYETPITHMCRVLTADTEVAGVALRAGEKVALWYTSANRDEAVFEDPHRFDVTRPVRPQHVGYGGGGTHFCLGANLARRELVVMFDEIRRRVPGLVTTDEPKRLASMSLNAIRSQPAAIS